ncbi:LDH2 family malate/lactate/ureidoglycolate dehydrogenase [Microbacterium sp. SORGH_AS 1204]|uniref:Ldh family oxidoreductase n=1 Tax=Microbacterium sp. SORGH_AS_1204 TaxID=3041785 RepID=UPI0027922B9C|nr:Ldh family oxidoreductase [Microbacterium sp. SORGH_AS_1204]MDQ1135410.1 LDH2 family malate/lactate/ureidoglycolate dehydrogenase [Microbacterium sp. SORGH_AS_1204]
MVAQPADPPTLTASRVDPAELRAFVSDVFQSIEVPPTDADLIADSLVAADEWGHQSHGVLRLPWYLERLRTGAMRPVADPTPVVDTGAMLILDGHDGIGQVLTERARIEAVSRAKKHGVGLVGVRNSNHFGTAMYFTRRAAADGCAAILTTNASPAMAPWGGREKRLGTNPWSIAAPYGDKVVVVDIANTAVARGKIYLARQKGEPIPENWALTQEGARTTDAAEAVHGVILPMAEHKGYAITFMMDVLSGALTGSAVGTQVHGPYEPDKRSGAGHMFIAIDVDTATDVTAYDERVATLVDEVKAVPLAHGQSEVFYPGEIEDRAAAAVVAAGGLLLPEQTVEDLRRVGLEQNVSPIA